MYTLKTSGWPVIDQSACSLSLSLAAARACVLHGYHVVKVTQDRGWVVSQENHASTGTGPLACAAQDAMRNLKGAQRVLTWT